MIVIGHLNPDTDSTCSAVAVAWLLERTGGAAEARLAGTPNKEAAYVLERFGMQAPPVLAAFEPDQEYVLVDTNNPEELAPGWEQARLRAVIDHHKLFGGLVTAEPVSVTMRAVACTATLVLERMKVHAVAPDPRIAGLMLAAILSDTLNYASPTTTEDDRAAGKELAALAETDPDELAAKMFEAKSDVSDLTELQLLSEDSKVFTVPAGKLRISVLETVSPEPVLGRTAALLEAMRALRTSEGTDGVMLFVIDILKKEAVLLVADPATKALARRAFGADPREDGTFLLPGLVSRKKQIVPKLEAA